MPATKFICPNGEKVNIDECLAKCKVYVFANIESNSKVAG